MSPFEEAAAAHAAAAAEVYGEPLRWLPQAGGGDFLAPGPDPDRPPREIMGTVTRRPRVIQREGAGARSAENLSVAIGEWQVGFDAALGLDTRPGDHVVRLSKPGQPVLRLAHALPIPGRVLHPADPVKPNA